MVRNLCRNVRKRVSLDTNTSVDETQAVARAEGELAKAHLSMDLELIDRLLHQDYKIIQPGGKIEGKSEVLASYRRGRRRWEQAESDQMEVNVYGEIAYVIGRWRARGVNNEEPFDYSARFLSVWIHEDGRWQNIAFQSMEITG